MLSRLATWIPMLLIWGASMLGTLQMNSVQSKWSYAACGPWGCGPTVEALIGYHAFWMAFLSLPVVLLFARFSERAKRRFGLTLIGVGAIALIGVGIYVAAVWYPTASEIEQAYWKQRYLYQVALMTDLPAIQFLIFGSSMWFLSKRSNKAVATSIETEEFSFEKEGAPSV